MTADGGGRTDIRDPAIAAPRSSGRFQLRPLLVVVHRVLGLTTALFLAVAGLTGSLLAFHTEIDRWLNPDAYTAVAMGAPLSPEALAARIEAGDPKRVVWFMSLEREPGRSAQALISGRTDPATGRPFDLQADRLHVDPVSGTILAERLWGECCFSRLNLVPFLYEFHHNLSLPGTYGILLMGGVGVLWLLDGFVGLALTFPRGRPFFAKWRPAFAIKGGSTFRLSLDLHRAAGLWLFAMLIAVALSSVAMNLRAEVVEPVVGLLSKLTPTPLSGAALEKPRERTLSYDVALEAGVGQARARGWDTPARQIFYSPHYGIFGVAFGEPDEPMDTRWLYFDGETAAYKGASLPGVGTAGDIFLQVQFPIHSGRILGLPGRILICVTGLAVAMLSVTGVVVWWKKRAGRKGRAAKSARAKAAPAE
ncbi:PepSY domain-containing protein [Xanthobacter dioxanivorans]|uniref:PepSY domain-containing protein n=1 Tax=Xanthobacter dioxanivorans TaxID=2528964 RepID=A0A974PMW1_9HYPH|nr:PepSY-associated TM helix domain-containing protein [Xanthobacter dioxanivorans]QRG06494.1 PepSY domain-containing protein [Xanthobacter dioxanivorans]